MVDHCGPCAAPASVVQLTEGLDQHSLMQEDIWAVDVCRTFRVTDITSSQVLNAMAHL
ncbi:hypothetical protein NEUTE1DRAFT_116013 [Neurospora tetrasperma FGSC 2508]|uniref:Uncharacterized protein n=1 Tax=Neurospora tetrasperma (strain FGSC 2508 / ATCC MYA-4615 / P0657) TaxID=510951 RepID=F8MBW6_NEUT8|nr:uncharacterized protein NEUTE1DRAFT_116013 [Neurospora tetrasperma FGSC 2508]EGO61175.1 hypothetical protein NEUTE1DRAFT_116013 [Neurospora tetrasperma FGSC 2508]EGZ74820.1 hypothetical protein NEUTE2DRAFT_143470 [Neurospora tetrasperma FGSC 2509]